jgi:hypothetical protein
MVEFIAWASSIAALGLAVYTAYLQRENDHLLRVYDELLDALGNIADGTMEVTRIEDGGVAVIYVEGEDSDQGRAD